MYPKTKDTDYNIFFAVIFFPLVLIFMWVALPFVIAYECYKRYIK